MWRLSDLRIFFVNENNIPKRNIREKQKMRLLKIPKAKFYMCIVDTSWSQHMKKLRNHCEWSGANKRNFVNIKQFKLVNIVEKMTFINLNINK